ncbi:hypothetical protein [Methylobacterium nigriterrae]|uniref:hypothetical protein n=1 Tax=Methylobacterium nigriterrae TaxID=3127512 RepID=UPI0030132069
MTAQSERFTHVVATYGPRAMADLDIALHQAAGLSSLPRGLQRIGAGFIMAQAGLSRDPICAFIRSRAF